MPQNRDGGADRHGRDVARKIAEALGATMVAEGSNRCTLRGENLFIKCVRARTPHVGLSYKMLEQLDGIILGIEMKRGVYELHALPPSAVTPIIRPTTSTGSKSGLMGIVKKSLFIEKGRRLGIITLRGPQDPAVFTPAGR